MKVLKKIFLLSLLGLLPVFFNACVNKPPILPPHDEILVYSLPFDLVFLRTLEAVENVSDWELLETEKEKGIIVARNVHYTSFDDAEKRKAELLITRLDRGQTTVQLAPRSQRVIGGAELMKKISERVSREL